MFVVTTGRIIWVAIGTEVSKLAVGRVTAMASGVAVGVGLGIGVGLGVGDGVGGTVGVGVAVGTGVAPVMVMRPLG